MFIYWRVWYILMWMYDKISGWDSVWYGIEFI